MALTADPNEQCICEHPYSWQYAPRAEVVIIQHMAEGQDARLHVCRRRALELLASSATRYTLEESEISASSSI